MQFCKNLPWKLATKVCPFVSAPFQSKVHFCCVVLVELPNGLAKLELGACCEHCSSFGWARLSAGTCLAPRHPPPTGTMGAMASKLGVCVAFPRLRPSKLSNFLVGAVSETRKWWAVLHYSSSWRPTDCRPQRWPTKMRRRMLSTTRSTPLWRSMLFDWSGEVRAHFGSFGLQFGAKVLTGCFNLSWLIGYKLTHITKCNNTNKSATVSHIRPVQVEQWKQCVHFVDTRFSHQLEWGWID